MFSVYILRSIKSGRHYIGCTNDIDRRLIEHNSSKTKSLRDRGPYKLIYKEDYSDLTSARRRERILKSYKGGTAFKKLIESSE